MKATHIFIGLILLTTGLLGQGDGYFIGFTDKNNSPFAIENPAAFLSQRAITRRINQNISIKEEDLPVNINYIDSLKRAGITIKHSCKWLNGVIAFSNNKILMDTLTRVSFVKMVELTKPLSALKSKQSKFETTNPSKSTISKNLTYGDSWDQVRTINAHINHNQGFKGEGIQIAIIDAGFYSVDKLPLFQHLWDNNQILGSKDFVNPQSNIFDEHLHGMKVLSIIAGEMSSIYIGTAPKASYWLLRSEDANSENPIEADYWMVAAEFADSVGVDLINTSLGYSIFDDASLNYSYAQMDGKSTRISKAASIAASKGIILVNSAGNDGAEAWKYISAPADAKDILTAGAMRMDSIRAYFSSFGPTYDGRIKPDITAMGENVATQEIDGTISWGSGTSYSAPLLTGAVACLWQANPTKTAKEIREMVLVSSNHYTKPDNSLGYGIPNFGVTLPSYITKDYKDNNQVFPNPFVDNVRFDEFETYPITIKIYNTEGHLLLSKINQNSTVMGLGILPSGLYIAHIQNQTKKVVYKLKKN